MPKNASYGSKPKYVKGKPRKAGAKRGKKKGKC